MIIITGSILASAGTIEEARAISLEHVKRSRAEPGCISHDVHVDVENPLRLVFVERWRDRSAVEAHFAVPASIDFAKAARRLSAEPTPIEIYEATPLKL